MDKTKQIYVIWKDLHPGDYDLLVENYKFRWAGDGSIPTNKEEFLYLDFSMPQFYHGKDAKSWIAPNWKLWTGELLHAFLTAGSTNPIESYFTVEIQGMPIKKISTEQMLKKLKALEQKFDESADELLKQLKEGLVKELKSTYAIYKYVTG